MKFDEFVEFKELWQNPEVEGHQRCPMSDIKHISRCSSETEISTGIYTVMSLAIDW